MIYHEYIDTHRCKGSLEHYMSIRYLNEKIPDQLKGWYLLKPEEDYEWMSWYNDPVCPIKYCPFCGKLLEEVKT